MINMLSEVERFAQSLNEICSDRYRGNQSAMAEALDIERSKLNRALNAKTQKPDTDVLAKVSAKLGYRVEWLRDRELPKQEVSGPPPSAPKDAPEVSQLREEVARLDAENARLREENARLEGAVEVLREILVQIGRTSDPSAREEAGFTEQV